MRSLLIANRGEIAVRIARAAADLGLRSVAAFSDDDALSLHVRKADEAVALGASGPAAYLDIDRVVAAAKAANCDALHPGYGFLSENAALARRCAKEGIVFVGPSAETLDLFGDKAAARSFAEAMGVSVIPGLSAAVTLDEAIAFLASLGVGGAVMIKALAGGGGRGMRAVHGQDDLAAAYAVATSEAKAAFGDGAVYVERLLTDARHIEIQIIGDGSGEVSHLHERECTLQRRNQKLVEIAPSPSLAQPLREAIIAAAVKMARAAKFKGLGTFEFLVEGGEAFFFIEANPRLQVEHTVTEAVTGADLVQAQLRVAGGASLASLGLTQDLIPSPRGFAVQLRINMESMNADGSAAPTGGVLAAFDPPSGPGVRVDTFGYAGYRTNVAFDSLLAKLIVHSAGPRYGDAAAKAYRALCEFRIAGVETNIGFLQALLQHPDVVADRVNTRFVEANAATLIGVGKHPVMFFDPAADAAAPSSGGAKMTAPAGTMPVTAPLQGTVVAIEIAAGDLVRPGQQIAVIEAMKMQHLVASDTGGIVRLVAARLGDTLYKDDPLAFIEPADVGGADADDEAAIDLAAIRPDLSQMRERLAFTLDENRPESVERRRKTGQRTARENVADLVDEGSFTEYGALAVAAQRARRSAEDLILNTPADGVVAGMASVNGEHFTGEAARCLVVAYDYTVLAGTQGQRNHKKQDRLFRLAHEWKLPIILFAEGGGGRPGDTERVGITGLDVPTFAQFARLSGIAPLIGVVSGYCFAGNAALLGCCHVIIATENVSIGMGGPAMIEGGGLGVYAPGDVGPASFQSPNGVIDILVKDEAEAVVAAKKYLSYFQGPIADWSCVDQRHLRRAIPENRLRVYEIRDVINALADEGSVLELRPSFGIGIVTAFVRIEGQPFGLIANNPKHLGGAIDSDAADKAARFVQLCDAFDIPIISLCDTPGFMVGPEAEKTGLVRHVCRMFVNAAGISVPYFTIVLRKGYGLGAQAMAAGGFHSSFFTVAWPTGEFGGMGLEGFVRLGYRKEMEAIADPVERQAYYEQMVASMYERGKASSIASVLEIDAVIDPVETRAWILNGLRSAAGKPAGAKAKRPFVDTW